MSNIKVNDLSVLNLTGAELFNDPESFMTELSEESEQVIGGRPQGAFPNNSCLSPTCVLTRKKCVATLIVVEEVKLSNIAIARPS